MYKLGNMQLKLMVLIPSNKVNIEEFRETFIMPDENRTNFLSCLILLFKASFIVVTIN